MDERDTHFALWASQVWQAIEEKCREQAIYLDSGCSSAELLEIMQPLIASAGYDLVSHARDILAPGEFVEMVPDVEARPEQEEAHTEE